LKGLTRPGFPRAQLPAVVANADGLTARRIASINDLTISQSERKFN
jgi:hypothetical protein